MLKYMLIKHKKIFKRFSCFWKVFFFRKFSKISKTMQPCSSDLPRRSSQSQAYTKGFCDPLASQGPSCEKDLENFSKIWVFRCLTTQFGDLCASGSSNRQVYSKFFTAPFATSSQVDLLVAKNTQTNFSNFSLKGFGDLFATHFSRENRVFCDLRTVY